MSQYHVKTESDLIYEENKDIIRAQVRFEANRLYKHKVNYLLDVMTRKFNTETSAGRTYRLAKLPASEFEKAVKSEADQILALNPGEAESILSE